MIRETFEAERAKYRSRVDQLRTRFLRFPRVVSIETFVSCNAACHFCPYPLSARKGERMETAVFDKILQDLSDIPPSHKFDITLARINEPLLDNRLRSFSEALQEKLPHAHQSFWSNGTTLVQKQIEWIKTINNATINVSLNAVEPDTHERYMGIALQPVLRNLDRLHEQKAAGDYPGTVRLTAIYTSEKESSDLLDFCRIRWPEFKAIVTPPFTWAGEHPTGNDLNANVNRFVDPQSVVESPCAQWFDLHILANGFVTKCCIDEAGFKLADYDVRTNHCLAIFAQSMQLRENLPSRSGVEGCRGCSHMG